MKRLYIIPLLILLTSCSIKETKIENTTKEKIDINYTIPEDTYIEDNPLKIGLYNSGKLMNEYYTTFHDRLDVIILDVIYTNNNEIETGYYKNIWKKYYNSYSDINIKDYKVGFFLEFDTQNDGHIENTILDPSTILNAFPYVGIYLYDDINQPDGSWYSHLETDDINENTVISSIKIYMHLKSSEITSPIKVTVFTYKNDNDFDENGYYRGTSKHTITIYNK